MPQHLETIFRQLFHIVLGHVDEDYIELHNCRALDEEVNQFIWWVHHYSTVEREMPKYLAILAAVSVIVGVIVWIHYSNQMKFDELKRDIIAQNGDYVFITVSGEKYHRENCSYAKNGVMVLRSEADKEYDPCKVCNP